MDVHPTKNGINRYWPIPTSQFCDIWTESSLRTWSAKVYLETFGQYLSQPTIGVKASDEMKERTLATRLGTAIKIRNDWDMK